MRSRKPGQPGQPGSYEETLSVRLIEGVRLIEVSLYLFHDGCSENHSDDLHYNALKFVNY